MYEFLYFENFKYHINDIIIIKAARKIVQKVTKFLKNPKHLHQSNSKISKSNATHKSKNTSWYGRPNPED